MADFTPDFVAALTNEGKTGTFSATLKNEAQQVLTGLPFTAIRATYFSLHSGTIINGRDGQNALNANNFTVSSGGEFVWKREEADTIITDTPKPAVATYRLVLTIEWDDADEDPRQTTYVVDFPIQRIDQAPFEAP